MSLHPAIKLSRKEKRPSSSSSSKCLKEKKKMTQKLLFSCGDLGFLNLPKQEVKTAFPIPSMHQIYMEHLSLRMVWPKRLFPTITLPVTYANVSL